MSRIMCVQLFFDVGGSNGTLYWGQCMVHCHREQASWPKFNEFSSGSHGIIVQANKQIGIVQTHENNEMHSFHQKDFMIILAGSRMSERKGHLRCLCSWLLESSMHCRAAMCTQRMPTGQSSPRWIHVRANRMSQQRPLFTSWTGLLSPI